jgi:hypothetical protein
VDNRGCRCLQCNCASARRNVCDSSDGEEFVILAPECRSRILIGQPGRSVVESQPQLKRPADRVRLCECGNQDSVVVDPASGRTGGQTQEVPRTAGELPRIWCEMLRCRHRWLVGHVGGGRGSFTRRCGARIRRRMLTPARGLAGAPTPRHHYGRRLRGVLHQDDDLRQSEALGQALTQAADQCVGGRPGFRADSASAK